MFVQLGVPKGYVLVQYKIGTGTCGETRVPMTSLAFLCLDLFMGSMSSHHAAPPPSDEPSSKPSLPVGGFHRRPLPPPAIAFSSPSGKDKLKRSLSKGDAEIYFRVSEAFRTQDEPAFCGLGTLVTALNALEVDPGQIWKGSWRWYAESLLDCCVDLDDIKQNGIGWDEFCCLARCQGLKVDAHRAEVSSVDTFRSAVRRTCASDTAILCMAYSRGAFGQAGDGHYSPIGAFDAESDHVLIMDVARFKHPPHWVPLEKMFESMLRHDKASGRSRGFAVLSRQAACDHCLESIVLLTVGRGRIRATEAFFRNALPSLASVASASSAEEALWVVARQLPPAVASLVAVRDPAFVPESSSSRQRLEAKRNELVATEVHKALAAADAQFRKRDGPLPASTQSIAALLLVAPCLVRSGEDDSGSTALASALGLAAPLIERDLAAMALPADTLAHAHPHGSDDAGRSAQPCASFAEDVSMARLLLQDMAKSLESTCQAEGHDACCN